HATLMPYADVESALKGKRKESAYCQSLNGTWWFNLTEHPAERPINFYKESFDVSGWDKIEVPSNWQLKGYPFLTYLNIRYPWGGMAPINPPHVPTEYNPVGSYRWTFTLPDNWDGREVF